MGRAYLEGHLVQPSHCTEEELRQSWVWLAQGHSESHGRAQVPHVHCVNAPILYTREQSMCHWHVSMCVFCWEATPLRRLSTGMW